MEGAYIWIIGILFTLAVLDLIVGVSNDAANFLNSALGSKVASRKVIFLVASVGIFLGAISSSGMMEIARKGIFNPSMFSFDDVLILFMAVMITDIILLDVFNSLGLPTSTTVSIVFELLGSALVLALIKSSQDPNHGLLEYINTESAFTIISGIFSSVVIAFTVGAIAQYLTRLWFSFEVEKRLPKFGGVFGGMAIAAIGYFVLIKGLKGSQLLSADQLDWIKHNTLFLLLGIFVAFAVLLQTLFWFFKLHPLRIVVLAGTFALAMAFAGNDLVNFIGVPITGFQSFLAYKSQALSGSELNMVILTEPVKTPSFLLLLAGLIMVLTLWFSGKARRVSATEINLSRQDAGEERFMPNAISRGLVGISIELGRLIGKITPDKFNKYVESRFYKKELELEPIPAAGDAAYDLVRASVNLMIASILIAMASSLKLPLSTTYVTFMVAMGTSLADRAWGRESAVYRVSGVLNVITGWFFTALLALLASAIMALVFYYLGMPAMLVFFGLALFILVKSHLAFKKKEKVQALAIVEQKEENLGFLAVLESSRKQSVQALNNVHKSLRISTRELRTENGDLVVKMRKSLKDQLNEAREKQTKSLNLLKRLKVEELQAGRLFLLLQDLLQDLSQSSYLLTETSADFLGNHHDPPSAELMDILLKSERDLGEILKAVSKAIDLKQFDEYETIQSQKKNYILLINQELDRVLQIAQQKRSGKRSAQLAISLLMESKDIAAISFRLLRLYKDSQ